jgi:hypothetical protein
MYRLKNNIGKLLHLQQPQKKYLGINFKKENYKSLKEEIKDDYKR